MDNGEVYFKTRIPMLCSAEEAEGGGREGAGRGEGERYFGA